MAGSMVDLYFTSKGGHVERRPRRMPKRVRQRLQKATMDWEGSGAGRLSRRVESALA